jgi:hypothetical protein
VSASKDRTVSNFMGSVTLTEGYTDHPLCLTHTREHRVLTFSLQKRYNNRVYTELSMCFLYDTNSLPLPFFWVFWQANMHEKRRICMNGLCNEHFGVQIRCIQFTSSVSGFKVGSWLRLPVIFLIPLRSWFLKLPYTFPPTTVFLYAGLIKPLKRKKDKKF